MKRSRIIRTLKKIDDAAGLVIGTIIVVAFCVLCFSIFLGFWATAGMLALKILN